MTRNRAYELNRLTELNAKYGTVEKQYGTVEELEKSADDVDDVQEQFVQIRVRLALIEQRLLALGTGEERQALAVS